MGPGHAEEHPAQVGRMVQVAPPQHHPGTVSHHHHADTQAGREGDHGQEEDAELGVGVEGGEHADDGADGATGPETQAGTPGGHFVAQAGQAGDDPGTEVDGQELLGAQQVHSRTHETGNITLGIIYHFSDCWLHL